MTKQIALITGASRGLGRSMALHLAKRGVAIIGTYRSGAAEADTLRQEIEALGGIVAMIPLDRADFGMVDAVYAPLFRYLMIIDPAVSQPIFEGLPRVSAWRGALAARASVKDAVVADYADRFRVHLRQHGAFIAV
ncbi:SDR family NAD(P)-dependent oxidoreductase [Ensifer sp. BR816]|uniref:SDR family NAD(P)-dependent oxidoreductase n=1 Tax=Rhizobium sp. (strain BR816) TaxID=1057002 RepID=UPI000369C2F6|nr:SDR family NAD(P)-dependent oxidoreductase [Ensifer sp. BR816]